MTKFPLFCLCAFLFLVSGSHGGEEWPQWRGPGGQGHAPAAFDLPIRWSALENVSWHTAIPGRGYSSPVISGSQIWLTTALEREASEEQAKSRLEENTGNQPLTLLSHVSLRAICLDRDTGQVLRNIELFSVENPQWVHKVNSYASPTPVLHQGRLYCHFGSLGSACVEVGSGRVLWKNQDLVVNHENGPGSTPVVSGGMMIFHMDGSDRQFVVALDTESGKVVWKTDRSGEMDERPQQKKSYGTPLLVQVGGRPQLISPAADWVYAYDPVTGRELWKFQYGELGFSNVSRPVVGQGMLFLPTGFGRSYMLGLELDGEGVPKEVWRHKKGTPRTPSPILVGGQLYYISDNGILSCLQAGSGEVLWRERLDGNYSASPLFAGGHLYFCSQEGRVQVVAPGRGYHLVADNDMGSGIMASPAAVGKAIYLRTADGLRRIEK